MMESLPHTARLRQAGSLLEKPSTQRGTARFGSFPVLVGFVAICALTFVARADYPLVSHRYAADPTALEYNGRLYLYCSNDDENGTNSYIMSSITCFSTDDLKNWTDHGVVFQTPQNASWATRAWAPSAISTNNRIYLYFANGASSIGVTTSSVPTGPFRDARGSALINSSTPGASTPNQWYFDPGAFIDSDGQPYLYFGGQYPTNSRVIRLNTNMTSVSGSAMTLNTPNFFEAAHLHRRSDTYYLTYSTRPDAGMVIGCVTNSNPTNGFVAQGTVLPNPPQNVNNNNHHSIVSFQGNWYIAYHNRTVALQNGLANEQAVYKRSACLDRVNYSANGTIQQVTATTDSLTQLKNLDPFTRVEAETIARQSGIKTAVCNEGGLNVTSITNGSWIRVRGVNFGSAGASNFVARIASAGTGGNIELRLDGLAGTLIGICPVTPTGGWQTWATTSAAVSNATARGVHDLYLKFTGGNETNLFNFNWWQFQSATNGSPLPADAVKFEAESGALGSEFAVSNSTPAYITILTDATTNHPVSTARVGTYTVTLPGAGTYKLYARVRVGPGTFNDDSLFYANGFGIKNPTLSSDWVLVNGLAAAGFTAASDIVAGAGSAGSGVWKWVNLSDFVSGPAFSVTSDTLARTFQIGARENGLDVDAFVLGLSSVSFTVAALDALAVATANTPPAFASASGQTVNPGVTVLVTNSVTDPDAPPKTLTFTLLTAPTNATLVPLNASNALFTWRPLVSQADSTNTIQVKVTDNGTPTLSATNSFVIVVNPASQPTFSSITLDGEVSLTGTGMIGPDYMVLTSTNLVNWETLFTTNPTAMPVTFADTNRGDAVRFYRLQLEP